uniref:G_PROTEIN_RECEP_F2_4 domain-containing protein n=1 Tax=Heterorhabditis bacteriophora TaxID=37862 RepID=A0A1I7XKQ6_HETBA
MNGENSDVVSDCDATCYSICGSVILTISSIFFLLYIPIILILIREEYRKVFSYQLLLLIGISDMIQLCVHFITALYVTVDKEIPETFNKLFLCVAWFCCCFIYWSVVLGRYKRSTLANYFSAFIWMMTNGLNPIFYLTVNRMILLKSHNYYNYLSLSTFAKMLETTIVQIGKGLQYLIGSFLVEENADINFVNNGRERGNDRNESGMETRGGGSGCRADSEGVGTSI